VGLRKPNGIGGASTSSASVNPHTNPDARVSDYLVGSVLDDALTNGDPIEVYWPFATGKIASWAQAEAIWSVLSLFVGVLGRTDGILATPLIFHPSIKIPLIS